MSTNLLGNNFITQIGTLVNDIEKTSQAYADFFGVDKPEAIITDSIEKAETEYKGEP